MGGFGSCHVVNFVFTTIQNLQQDNWIDIEIFKN